MADIKFGTDGWRAVISDDFTFENVKIVAQAIADYLLENKEQDKDINILIGYDTRFMSDEYAKLVARVLAGNDIKVLISEKEVPTPVLSHNVVDQKADGGIVITASHNPACFNGIKFKGSYGGPADPEETAKIEQKLYKNEIKIIDLDKALENNSIKYLDMDTPYLKCIFEYVDIEKIKNSKLKILVDSMHGVGTKYIENIFKNSNCSVKTIHGDINPSFGGAHPEPIYFNLKELMEECKDNYDIGFATDGDADRIGVVDNKGNYIFSHETIALLGSYLKETRNWSGGIVKSISTTSLIDVMGEDLGIKVYETPVGFKHICELMRSEDILIGGEESGGIGYKNHIPERDSILSALLLMEMVLFYNKTLKEILDDFRDKYGRFYYDRKDIKYNKNEMDKVLSGLKDIKQEKILDIPVKEIKDTDGVKHILEDGSWLLVRASGTEPIVRIYAESKDKDKIKPLIDLGEKLVFG
jgi:alpha-D-glucose phosphate-specific phosphoglucomutase